MEKKEFQFWTVDFNFGVQVHNSGFIFMARCVVFKWDDVEFTGYKRSNKWVEVLQYKF